VTATTTEAPRPDPLTGRGRRGDHTFRALTFGAGVVVLVVLVLIAYSTTHEAWPAMRHAGLGFVTKDDWDPNNGHFGALALIFGTVISSLIAVIFAVPISIGIALFITELAPPRLAQGATTVIDLLAAIPSVVYGLWVGLALAPTLDTFYQHVADTFHGWPVLGYLFGGDIVSPRSILTAGLLLGIMITPIITSLTRDVLATIPGEDRAGALALGATRWEALRIAVFPRVRGGITGAVMLGLGRAMGETIAIALVMGQSAQITLHLFQPGASLAGTIANNFGESSGLYKSALIGLGVILFGLTLIINGIARSVTHRTERKLAS
jgi:phosphate transport system permease protein